MTILFWVLGTILTYLLLGIGVAEATGRLNNHVLEKGHYRMTVLLWGLILPLALYNSFTNKED